MGPEPTSAEQVAKRRDVLAALTAPMTKPELVDALDSSRSTVDRAIRSLADCALVERQGSEYRATYMGREALSAYDRFCSRVTALERAQPVLETLPPTVDIDPAVLEGATVVESTPEAPEAPIEANMEYVTETRQFQGTGPTVLPRQIAAMKELVDLGVETELVLTESVVEALTETYAEEFELLADADGLSVYVTDKQMPFAVWTAAAPDRTGSGIVVYDDTGLAGVINNDTEAMNEWAQSVYERYKADAERLF